MTNRKTLPGDEKLNFESARRNFDIEFVQQCVNNIDPRNHYIQAYPSLLDSTKILYGEMEEKAIPVIAHLAYGWMPTIPKNINFGKETNRKILEASKICSIDQSVNFIKSWHTPPVNNSWVGSSKVLHFINPEFFPIWDSKVAKHFTKGNNKKLSDSDIRMKSGFYADYVEFCKDIADSFQSIFNVQKAFENKVKYSVTKFRAIEYVLFSVS